MPQRFTVVRTVIGVLLLAAGLKLYGLSVSAIPRAGWFAQPWVQLATAEWERCTYSALMGAMAASCT